MDIESLQNTKELRRGRIGMGILGGALYLGSRLTQGLAISIEGQNPDFFTEWAINNPGIFQFWKNFNHLGSSLAYGMIGVAYFKHLFDRVGKGGLGSDMSAVIGTTLAYSIQEAFAVRRPNTEFSVEDVMATAVTATLTVLVDGLIRRRSADHNQTP